LAGHGSTRFPLRTDTALSMVHGTARAASAGSRNHPIKGWKGANSHSRRGYAARGFQDCTCHQPCSWKAKFWISPTVELARNIGLNSTRIKEAERLAETRQQEIIDAWNNHFRG
jgi:hypothetical protein